MDGNPFLSLSQELILAICEELALNDLKHMRLTCTTLANGAASLVLSHISIPAEEATTIEDVVSDLQFLAKTAGNCPSKITINEFSSIFPEDRELECNIDKLDANGALCMKRISQDFLTALTSFKIVRTVNWYPGENDPLWLQEIIWNAIRIFPNLRHLTINPFFLKQPLGNLDSLTTLESINILGDPFNHNGALFLGLSKLYASSSNLNSITIHSPEEVYDVELLGDHGLQQLFSSSPGENRAHRLRYLSISNVPVRLDEVTLSHLANLTSFKLSSLPYISNGADLNTSPDNIWVAFRRSGIRLEELEVGCDVMADSLNDYLSSFSGLKKLELSIPGFESQASSEASAVKFWSDSFPNHIDTLQDFTLLACYDGQWCFGRHNRSLIAECTKLEQLKVSVLPGDIPTQESDFNGINALIDTVVTHLSHTNRLGLEVPLRDAYRGHRCGTGSFSRRARDGYQLMDWVLKYKPPASCQRLPQLTVNCDSGPERVFVGISNARRSRLRYYSIRDSVKPN